jgi:hypothetical protein
MQDHPPLKVVAETFTGFYDGHIRIECCEIVVATHCGSSLRLLHTPEAANTWPL